MITANTLAIVLQSYEQILFAIGKDLNNITDRIDNNLIGIIKDYIYEFNKILVNTSTTITEIVNVDSGKIEG